MITQVQSTPNSQQEQPIVREYICTKGIHKQYTIVRNLSVQYGRYTHIHTCTHTESHIQCLQLLNKAHTPLLEIVHQFQSHSDQTVTHILQIELLYSRTGETMYMVSFIKYCTYWPIASHSKCYDNAPKSVTQSIIYTIVLYKSTQISQD